MPEDVQSVFIRVNLDFDLGCRDFPQYFEESWDSHFSNLGSPTLFSGVPN